MQEARTQESQLKDWLGTAGVCGDKLEKKTMDEASELKKEYIQQLPSTRIDHANFKGHEAEQEKQHKDPGRVIENPAPSVGQADTCPHESCKAALQT